MLRRFLRLVMATCLICGILSLAAVDRTISADANDGEQFEIRAFEVGVELSVGGVDCVIQSVNVLGEFDYLNQAKDCELLMIEYRPVNGSADISNNQEAWQEAVNLLAAESPLQPISLEGLDEAGIIYYEISPDYRELILAVKEGGQLYQLDLEALRHLLPQQAVYWNDETGGAYLFDRHRLYLINQEVGELTDFMQYAGVTVGTVDQLALSEQALGLLSALENEVSIDENSLIKIDGLSYHLSETQTVETYLADKVLPLTFKSSDQWQSFDDQAGGYYQHLTVKASDAKDDQDKPDSANEVDDSEDYDADQAFRILRQAYGWTDDIIVTGSEASGDGAFDLRVASQALRASGGSGTVGRYRIYVDGRIIDLTEDAADDSADSSSLSSDEAISLLYQTYDFDDEALGVQSSEFVDAEGGYYRIYLYVKEWRESGGSGTAGSYRVYLDGRVVSE